MKKSIRLTESQLIDAIDRIIKESIDEVESSGGSSNARPGREAGVKIVTKTIGADSLFATGKSDVDTNSRAFRDVVNGIVSSVFDNNIKKPFTITIQGGASAVGSPRFNNKALADKRAYNMLSDLNGEVTRRVTVALDTTSGLGFKESDYYKFETKPSVVGTATVKDSPEAKAEQFVKVSYPTSSISTGNATTAIDNTATNRPNLGGGKLTPVPTPGKEDELSRGISLELVQTGTKKVALIDVSTHLKINKILKEKGMYLSPTNIKKPRVGGVS